MVASPIPKLDSVTFDDFVAQHAPFAGGPCSLDLRPYRFISTAAMVQLAALCHAISRTSQRATILLEDPQIRGYLSRAGFVAAVSDVAKFDTPFSRLDRCTWRRGLNPFLIEVTRIETGGALPPLLDQIVSVLRVRLRYRKNDAFDVATVVSEICQNTFDHNSNIAGFLGMQVFGKGQKRFLEIGVADNGEGLALTLQRNPKNGRILTDIDGIHMATQLRTSQHDDPTRGTGLYHLLEITYKHEGAVQIRSGAGKVRYRMDRRQGWSFAVAAVPGVQIAMSLRAKAG